MTGGLGDILGGLLGGSPGNQNASGGLGDILGGLVGSNHDVTAGSFLTLSDASSPLLSTKARFDATTYPWLVKTENVAKRAGKSLVVLMNDFIDNALTSHAIAMTRQRAAML